MCPHPAVGQPANYEIDGEEGGTALRADEYGGDEDFAWVMLEPAGAGPTGGDGPSPAAESQSPAAVEA